MTLPVNPPVKPMLAKLKPELPLGEDWRYEPKWDGFRAIVFRDDDWIHIASRDLKPLERYFPELAVTLLKKLPPRCVIDGEVLVAVDGVIDFDQLQQRIHPAESRVKMLSEEIPSSFIGFDLLAVEDEDLRQLGFDERRARLETLLPIATEPEATDGVPRPHDVLLTPTSRSEQRCRVWLEGIEHAGIEGVVAKLAGQAYAENAREMIKVKLRRTADCVVAAYRMNKTGDGIASLLLGLHDSDGVLHYVGHTSSFKATERRSLLEALRPLEGPGGFGHGNSPGGQSRWTSGKPEASWVGLRPELVCEVAFDKMQGVRFRHAATFQRWRPEREPSECTFDQTAPGRG